MAENEQSDPRGDVDEHSKRKEDHDAQQEELLRKLPDDADPDQERGERHSTGKGTATAGASEHEDEEGQERIQERR